MGILFEICKIINLKLDIMKNNICLMSIFVVCLLSGCNNGKNNNDTTIGTGTDSSLMVKNEVPVNKGTEATQAKGADSTSGNIAPAAANDSLKNNSSATDKNKKSTPVVANKPDSSKKSKRGRISIGQNKETHSGALTADKEGFYNNTEILPAFNGGQKGLENFFEKNIQYPQEATDNNAEGTVLLNFAVDENGKIYAPKVISKPIGFGIEKESLRVFNKMPVWLPGKIKGKNVKTRYTLPIKFQLDN